MTATGAWHPDPIGEASWRWWDGAAWSGQTGPAREIPELAPLSIAHGKSVMLDQEDPSKIDVLKCDGVPVGLLHTSAMGNATGETASGSWNFDREGIIRGAARVLVQPSNTEIGRFEWEGVGTGTDGTLQFIDGRWLRLTRATHLAQEGVQSPAPYDPHHQIWVWYGPDRQPISTVRLAVRYKTKKVFGKEITYTSSSTSKTGSDIWTDFHPPAATLRELPVITMLSTFLIWQSTMMKESVARDRHRF